MAPEKYWEGDASGSVQTWKHSPSHRTEICTPGTQTLMPYGGLVRLDPVTGNSTKLETPGHYYSPSARTAKIWSTAARAMETVLVSSGSVNPAQTTESSVGQVNADEHREGIIHVEELFVVQCTEIKSSGFSRRQEG